MASSATKPFHPWAVIAAKSFHRSKSRLGTALGARERYALARSMFETVMAACAGCHALCGTLVVTDGDEVAALSARYGAAVLRDPIMRQPRLNTVVDAALRTLPQFGATHALVLMADLPRAQSCDLAELLAALRETDLLVVPDRQRRGTSALGLNLAAGMQSRFGHPDSLAQHLQEAARIGLRGRVIHSPRLAHDIDTLDDIAQWRDLRRASRALALV